MPFYPQVACLFVPGGTFHAETFIFRQGSPAIAVANFIFADHGPVTFGTHAFVVLDGMGAKNADHIFVTCNLYPVTSNSEVTRYMLQVASYKFRVSYGCFAKSKVASTSSMPVTLTLRPVRWLGGV